VDTMLRIDRQFLVELGLGQLDRRKQEVVKRRIYEVLEGRVGLALINSLTKAEQEVFERAMSESSEKAHDYLSSVVPNYAAVVRNELEYVATAIAESVRQGTVLTDSVKRNEADNG
jgi:repressor of nif and glnA expression